MELYSGALPITRDPHVIRMTLDLRLRSTDPSAGIRMYLQHAHAGGLILLEELRYLFMIIPAAFPLFGIQNYAQSTTVFPVPVGPKSADLLPPGGYKMLRG